MACPRLNAGVGPYKTEHAMAWVRDKNSFWNFIGYVVLRAPDRFPVEDYLKPDEQMNLERAFVELSRGIQLMKSSEWPTGHV